MSYCNWKLFCGSIVTWRYFTIFEWGNSTSATSSDSCLMKQKRDLLVKIHIQMQDLITMVEVFLMAIRKVTSMFPNTSVTHLSVKLPLWDHEKLSGTNLDS